MGNKIKINLLDNCDHITSKRKDGNTTRLIDKAIQLLFQGFIVIINDHHENNTQEHSNYLAERIIKRLNNEHNVGILYDLSNSEMFLLDLPKDK